MKSLRLLLCVVAAAMFSAGNAYAQQSDRVFFSFNAANGLADNSAQTIKCTRTGRMVISTIGHVNFYDGGSFTHIDPTEKNVFPLPGYNGHYHMYFDRFHHLWLKDRRSVTCVDLLTERFIEDVGSVIRELGLKQHIDDMFGDSDSRLWFRYGNKLYSPDIQKELAKRMIQHKSAYATRCKDMPTDASISQHYDNEYEYKNENVNDFGNGFEKDARENLHPYGERQNIYLTDVQYFGLARKYGNDCVIMATNTAGYTKQTRSITGNTEDYRLVLECLKMQNASCQI